MKMKAKIKITYDGYPSHVVVENLDGSERRKHVTYSAALADVATRFEALERRSIHVQAGHKAAETRRRRAAV
jgi:uncharacterized protein Veg